jgi:hypothetical protein
LKVCVPPHGRIEQQFGRLEQVCSSAAVRRLGELTASLFIFSQDWPGHTFGWGSCDVINSLERFILSRSTRTFVLDQNHTTR